ncbi:hypothetical protein [Staphylospora marina]|uniref:hypothetical protein n=1 Tax=Staphylospora marina TaxID=2490858 RepID=UPI000F5BF1E3|nr:hypothetical protein [Staphylospora marina]
MTHFEPGYDVILIGAGESGRETLNVLENQGKRAFYIELAPETVATLISQNPPASEEESPSRPLSVQIGDREMPIRLYGRRFRTAAGETVTYTLQITAEESPENRPVNTEVHMEEDVREAEPDGWNVSEEPEVLEAEQVEYASPYTFVSEREAPFREKLSKRRKISFQDAAPEQETDMPVYTLERLTLSDDEEDDEWTRTDSYAPEQEADAARDDHPLWQASRPPVYRERELKLRKRLFASNRLSQTGPAEMPPESSHQPIADFAEPQPYVKESVKESAHEPAASPAEPELFQLEPISRKRARSQKKVRIQKKLDEIQAEARPAAPPAPQPAEEPDPSFFSPYPGGLFGGGQPSIQPFSRPTSEKEPESSDSHEALKKDDIELEDAFGGYNSWEEFMTPFSEGSRKRQEIDKVEKRKIALRGLHNLINNLG